MHPRPTSPRLVSLLVVVAWLAGCANTPPSEPPSSPLRTMPPLAPDRDGPEPNPPPDLERVPDAEPRIEPLRIGGPNKPYELLGRSYTPIAADTKVVERGLASWYGRKFHGRPTASGERYDMYAMTAAHPRLPLPSYARVRNPANGREVVVRINDRGPFHPGRIVDLSYTAALKLGILRGVAMVELERLTHEEIRTGAWRRGSAGQTLAAATPADASSPDPAASGASPAAPAMSVEQPAASAAVVAASAEAAEPGTVAEPAPSTAGFWVQLGAFGRRDSALSLQQRVLRELQALAPALAIFEERSAPRHRLQAGPYASRDEAARVAQRLRELLRVRPLVVERR